MDICLAGQTRKRFVELVAAKSFNELLKVLQTVRNLTELSIHDFDL